MTMTVAQAIRKINALLGEIKECDEALRDCVVYRSSQEVAGEMTSLPKPAFNFDDVLKERDAFVSELIQLRAAVAKTNASMTLNLGGKEMPLLVALHECFQIKATLTMLESIPSMDQAITENVDVRHEWNESADKVVDVRVKTTTVCEFTKVQKQQEVRALRRLFANLNNAIEAANNATTLLLEPSDDSE